MTNAEIVKLILEGTSFVAEAIGRFLDGDTSVEVRRVIDILGPELQSELELHHQRTLTKQALEARFDTEPPGDA